MTDEREGPLNLLDAIERWEATHACRRTRRYGRSRPDVFGAFTNLRKLLTDHAGLSLRERSILVCATAATLNDAYCALAWGKTLAAESNPGIAAAVLQGQDHELAAAAPTVVRDAVTCGPRVSKSG